MKFIIAAICFLLAAWLAVNTFGADPTPDPRLVRIAERRQLFLLQSQNAELAFRVAQFELRELEREEKEIKAEKPTKESK